MKNIFILLLLLPFISMAQLNDNFSDGDFTQNPSWTGDDIYFLINNEQLQSNGPNMANSKIHLSTTNTLINQTEWSFLVDLKFNPTATTFVRVYLCSTSDDLKNALDGYFIHIGNTNEDYIKFYKQTGLTTTELFTGSTSLGSGNIKVRIKVTRDNTGNWHIYCDNTGAHNYSSEGTINDNTFTSTDFFGVYCDYSTASRYNLYYFDDFYIGPVIVDTSPPVLQSVNVLNANQLELYFNEPVEQLSSENTLNYEVNLGIGTPISAERDANNQKKVTLSFSSSFTLGLNYQLSVYNIEDLSQNLLNSQTISFVFYIPGLHDVVFNELMADPSPTVGLPDFEYIELYNRTNAAINLQGWKFKYGSTEKNLPFAIIPADSFIVFTSPSGFAALSTFGNVISIDGLSTTALTNSGTTLILYDNNYNMVHAINYTDTWYQDNNKKDGGWSLEQIDPENPCGGINNWKASTDISGGTPGKQNSVKAINSDNVNPDVIRVGIIDSVTIEVFFSERMLEASLTGLTTYQIDNNIGQPTQITAQAPLFTSAILKLSNIIQANIKYKLTVDNQIQDCAGNIISAKNYAYFGIPQAVTANDVVINEILFNPPTNGVDYVEIYNRSNKIIDLKDLKLCSKDTILNELTSIKNISEGSYLIFPGDYIVLTTNKSIVQTFYNTTQPYNFLEMASLPSFNNENGIAVLSDMSNTEIDIIIYTEDMHYPLLTSFKGVSLERIHYDRPSNDASNWHSASEAVGFGTPCYKNSQFGIALTDETPINLSPDIFSPDNDGYNDVLHIAYKFEQAGYVANIMIFDARGRQVRYLIKNELLGTEGIFSWDGITEDKQKAGMGIYIVFFEVFDLSGQVKSYKKTTVLGGRLN